MSGAWYTDAKSFILAGRTSGCQYEVLVRQSKFQFAVSTALRKCYPSIMLLMRAIANVLGTTCELYSSVGNLTKQYHKQRRDQKRKKVAASAAKWFILSVEGEQFNIDKENRVLYRTVPGFIRLVSKANAAARRPGYP